MSHLTDEDLIAYLSRCCEAIQEKGVICVKENVSSFEDTFDPIDSSVTRCEQSLKSLFKKANLVVVAETLQHGFPEELFPVKMYALVPHSS